MDVQFPTRYYAFHPDANLNFQLNRCLTWAGEACHDEIQLAAARIRDFADWKRELLTLAEAAQRQGRRQPAAYYYRAAEFFMTPGDPDKEAAYDRFIELIRQCFPVDTACQFQIPYAGGFLPAVRFPVENSRGTLVAHGGFDSFIEELFPVRAMFSQAGYTLVLFEGPGQGAALKKHGLVMTPEWEKPVRAVLDYFHLEDVTLLGMSLGGYLATRAAAFEPRIRRVIAFDVMYDFFDCLTSRRKAAQRPIRLLTRLGAAPLLNALAERLMARDLLANWGIRHGMYVFGCASPFAFFRKLQQFNTRGLSRQVTQDYLLLAGTGDHFVPLQQFYQQAQALTGVRSFTGRIFTAAEQAQGHCQVGNIALALRTMIGWLAQFDTASVG